MTQNRLKKTAMSAQETVFETIFGRLDWGDRPAILGERACTYGELLAGRKGWPGP